MMLITDHYEDTENLKGIITVAVCD